MQGKLIAMLLACAAATLAQSRMAEVTGLVRDSSGSIVPGARVSVHNVETGIDKSGLTNDAGLYTIPEIDPGSYALTVEKPGFRTIRQEGLTLHVHDRARIDLTLQVGEVSSTVLVQADAPLLQADDASSGMVVDNTKIVNLPLNERNPYSLAALTPGVQPGGGFYSSRVTALQANQSDFTVNGGAAYTNEILLDGTANTTAG